MTIDTDDIRAHIDDYVQILAAVDTHPGTMATHPQRRHELALTIMRVHEMHRGEHLQREYHK